MTTARVPVEVLSVARQSTGLKGTLKEKAPVAAEAVLKAVPTMATVRPPRSVEPVTTRFLP